MALRGLLMVWPCMTTGCRERRWMGTVDDGMAMLDRGMAVVAPGMSMEDHGGAHGRSWHCYGIAIAGPCMTMALPCTITGRLWILGGMPWCVVP